MKQRHVKQGMQQLNNLHINTQIHLLQGKCTAESAAEIEARYGRGRGRTCISQLLCRYLSSKVGGADKGMSALLHLSLA